MHLKASQHRLTILCFGFLILSLNACVEQKNLQLPVGYYPDPARELHQSLRQLLSHSDWQAPPDLPLALQVTDDKALVANYFQARYPLWTLHKNAIHLFTPEQVSLLFFEPKPPFADDDYAQKIEPLNANQQSIKQALDEVDIRFAHDYMGRARPQQNDKTINGIVHFFHLEQRPRFDLQQRVYGIFAHYQPAQAENPKQSFMRIQALLYDPKQKLFYYRNAQQGEKFWLYALAHPTDTPLSIWAGEQKMLIKGVQAKGGQCGRSVREWFSQQQKQSLLSWGYNHLGSGSVRYDKAGKPIGLSQHLAFDEKRAKNLRFEPQPPLSDTQLKDYQDRLTLLNAKFQPLIRGLDNLDIHPDKAYMGASRGAKTPLSHVGIVRFYRAHERMKDAENRAVYGEFIHNWNRQHRSGPMTINAIYYDPENNLFYWKNGEGHKKKMWIYGIADTLELSPDTSTALSESKIGSN